MASVVERRGTGTCRQYHPGRMAEDERPIERLDASNAAVFAGMTERTRGGRVIRQDGLLLVIGADPSPVVVNTILTAGDEVEPHAIERAVEVYRAVGHVPSLMTRDDRD